MNSDSQPQIVVLGAGVLGLTTALNLALEGNRSVTVVAKHMPGDHHPEYTSLWAGVNWVPVSAEGSEEAEWDIVSWNELKKLADTTPAAGVWLQDKTTYYRKEDLEQDRLHLWFKDLVPDVCGGTALGGSYYNTWNHEPDMALAERIMQRSVKVCPGLVPSGAGVEALRVVRHQVGLRPVRAGGPRIETQVYQHPVAGTLNVVHCYGAGGFGFQSSYGMAGKAAHLVRECLGVEMATAPKASL